MSLIRDCPDSAWEAGAFHGRTPRLLFGRMYEDCAIELRAFERRSRVFCIASAGCTAHALALAGCDVTAVDINPIQVAYARARAEGQPHTEGVVERLLSCGRALLSLFGRCDRKRREFLMLEDTAEQVAYWERNFDSPPWRAALDGLLSPRLLRLIYAHCFVQSLPRHFGACLRARLRRCWAMHPNRCNPYAWSVLSGEEPLAPEPCPVRIQFECADAASYLESCPVASFDAFTLSNIVDGASADYIRRLNAAVRRAAAPDALVVSRSFAEPAAVADSNWAGNDRSFLWGIVDVRPIANFDLCSIY